MFKHSGLGLLLSLLAALLVVGGLGACSPIRALNVVSNAASSYRMTAGVPYGELPRQKLDIYTPRSAAPAGGWPMVVFFYGGSWNSGERAAYEFVGTALASRGVLTLVADYRLYPEVSYPDFLIDSALAMAWGFSDAERLGANPKRVFVMGHSAGGYNAAMLALDARWLAPTGHTPQELAGWIGLAGAYDFFPSDDPELQVVFHHPNYPADGQPIDHPSAAAPPSFLATGVNDRVVSPERSTESLAALLQADHVPVTLKLYPHATHATLLGAFGWPLRWVGPVLDDVTDFIATTPPTP
jgi:acetyl esterase/lipase